jgi:hypothetical protein
MGKNVASGAERPLAIKEVTMTASPRRVARRLACGALSLGLIAGAPMLVAGAQAQTATIVDPNAAKGSLSSHDAALDAARRGDYVAALEFSKKAAAEGQPLDGDQVDFITGKASKQQAAADEAAKTKASQQAASAQAQEILARQQKDYAERSKEAQEQCSSDPGHIGIFTSAAGAAASQGSNSAIRSSHITGADDKKC